MVLLEFNFGHLSNDQIEKLTRTLNKKQDDWDTTTLDWNSDGDFLLYCHIVNVG